MQFKKCGSQTDAMIRYWEAVLLLLVDGGKNICAQGSGIYHVYHSQKRVLYIQPKKLTSRQINYFEQNKEVLEYLGYTIDIMVQR